jgi:hypothetical protein
VTHLQIGVLRSDGAWVPVGLDDAALIAAILDARIAEAPRLAAGAAKRRLTAAVAAFERLCRKFIGISVDRTIPEQIAAMEALAMIGEHLRVKRSCTSSSRVSCRGLISSPRWLKPRN